MEKHCSHCHETKPAEDFHKDKRRKDGRQAECKVCQKTRRKSLFDRDPVRYNAIAGRARVRNQEQVVEYLLAHPCIDCGEPDPVVLEFDHLRDKLDNVSRLVNHGVRWDKVLSEIAKCEVVCANCHRRRTAKRAETYRLTAQANSV